MAVRGWTGGEEPGRRKLELSAEACGLVEWEAILRILDFLLQVLEVMNRIHEGDDDTGVRQDRMTASGST